MNEPQVTITSYSVPVPDECPALLANYLASRSPRGLVVLECECSRLRLLDGSPSQAHCFALPWDDAMERWVSHQISPIRHIIEAKGFKPDFPAPSPHVILIDHIDAPLLKTRRWRVFRTTNGWRVKWCLQSGPRGLGLQRFILPSAECVVFDNLDGLDFRRENIRGATLKTILKERNRRHGWKTRKAKKKKATAKKAAMTKAGAQRWVPAFSLGWKFGAHRRSVRTKQRDFHSGTRRIS